MKSIAAKKGSFRLTVYPGDAKSLLAFDLAKSDSTNLAGFSIQVEPKGQDAYYLQNELQFEKPFNHAQDSREPANSSINAPIHKFRWIHVPGSVHQGIAPLRGEYTYRVTPRYFKDGRLMPLDPALGAAAVINVVPFVKGNVALGFTRGFTQSQAFVHHFGHNALIRPKSKSLIFDTSQKSGVNAHGEQYTFEQEYQWLGFTAREKLFVALNEVLADKTLSLDLFAYDLNEPDFINILLELAKQGRIRIILDNATLHHDVKAPKAEDQFEAAFNKVKVKGAELLRGKYGRYAHDKVLIIYKAGKPIKVVTGSTNFSITGLYVNSNHVIVFEDAGVAAKYAEVFQKSWETGVKASPFRASDLSAKAAIFGSKQTPKMEITFSPHDEATAQKILNDIAKRIADEERSKGIGSVLFAVMEMDKGTSPVYTALKQLHAKQKLFSFGISDNPGGIYLYQPGNRSGVLVSGKPASTVLPAPFDQVPGIGAGHQVHHKFVVCGFNTPNAVVYCGSSNLAGGGETVNGDNLLAIHDSDIATVFAIEALGLVDHFQFLDRCASKSGKRPRAMSSNLQAAADAHWFLSTTDQWARSYFDTGDLHCVDRKLFGAQGAS